MVERADSGALLLELVLARQTKDELTKICRRFQIKGVSGLRKSKLVAFLCQRLPIIAAGKMLSWDQSIYDLVREITTFGRAHHLDPAVGNPVEDYLLEEYIGFAKTVDGTAYLVIPLEYQEIFYAFDGELYRQKVASNTEIARLSRGLLHYYGCLTLAELSEMLNRLLPKPVETVRIGEVLREIGFHNWHIVYERGRFCDGRLTDLDYLLRELKEREALEYRPLTYQEVWQAGEPGFFHRNPRQLREVRRFLQKHGLNEAAPYFLDLLFSLVQTDLSPPEIVYALLENSDSVTEDDITELALVVFDFYHSVPHWVLKGFSPEEIMERASAKPEQENGPHRAIVYDFATKQPLSPESPCPCGSKRSFGACCGSA